jgi:hypothetical protein
MGKIGTGTITLAERIVLELSLENFRERLAKVERRGGRKAEKLNLFIGGGQAARNST